MILSKFEFDVIRRAGIKHQAADTLPRLPTTGENHTVLKDDLHVLAIETPNSSSSDLNKQDAFHNDYIPTEATQHRSDNTPPSKSRIIAEQAIDPYSCAATLYTGTPQSEFHTDSFGILAQKSLFDELIQIVVSASLLRRMLYSCHYPPIAGHLGQRRIYDTLCCYFCLPHMASEVQHTVAKCVSCARTGSKYRHKRCLQLFPAYGPLEFVVIDVLCPFPKTRQGSQLIVVMTNFYSKLMRAISTSKTSSTHVADVFLDNWVVQSGISEFVLAYNGPQITSKFSTMLCIDLEVMHLTTTVYHPQTNG